MLSRTACILELAQRCPEQLALEWTQRYLGQLAMEMTPRCPGQHALELTHHCAGNHSTLISAFLDSAQLVSGLSRTSLSFE